MNIADLPKNIIRLLFTYLPLNDKYLFSMTCKKIYNYISKHTINNIPSNVKSIDILDLTKKNLIQLPETDIIKVEISEFKLFMFPKYVYRLILNIDSEYYGIRGLEQVDELIILNSSYSKCMWSIYEIFNNLKVFKSKNINIRGYIQTNAHMICKEMIIESESFITLKNITCNTFICQYSNIKIYELNIIYDIINKCCFANHIINNSCIIEVLNFIGVKEININIYGLISAKKINFINCSEEFITYVNELKN